MGKKESDWPEIVISSGDNKISQSIRCAAKNGILRKIATKIYTSNLLDTPENIINLNFGFLSCNSGYQRHRYQILGFLFPNGVISHASALDGGISPDLIPQIKAESLSGQYISRKLSFSLKKII